MDLISIIVPVYNIEAYIERCVNSILNQTYKNLQIILVDDGSIDNSGDICDKIAPTDSRIQVIHKTNGGLSDARNEGIKVANGKYIGFVDGDDYIDKDMYRVLYSAIIEYDSEIASCGYYEQFADKIDVKCCSEKTVRLDRIQAYEALFIHKKILGCSSCNKLFSAQLFKDNKYRVGIIGEDLEIIYRLLNEAEGVVCVNKSLYYYIHRENSITTSSFSIKNMGITDILTDMVKFIDEKYPSVKKQAYAYQCTWLIGCIISIDRNPYRKRFKKEKELLRKCIIINFKNYYNNKYVYFAEYILIYATILRITRITSWLIDKNVRLYHSLTRNKA